MYSSQSQKLHAVLSTIIQGNIFYKIKAFHGGTKNANSENKLKKKKTDIFFWGGGSLLGGL